MTTAEPIPLTGHDCAYCGAILTPGVERVCGEQGGDPPGTWYCSEGEIDTAPQHSPLARAFLDRMAETRRQHPETAQ